MRTPMERDNKRRVSGTAVFLACLMVVALIAGLGLSACGGLLAAARDMEKDGDLNGAIVAYQKVLAENPDNIEILAPLGADLMLAGKYDEALPIQEKIVRLDEKDVQTRVELGFNYLNHQSLPAAAVRVLKEVVELDGSAKNLTFMAQAQMAVNDTVGAEASLRQALAKDPKYPHAYSVLRELLIKLDRSQEAVQIEDLARQQGVTIESSQ
jgi:tetratricopeptide (TPR) repeat protein